MLAFAVQDANQNVAPGQASAWKEREMTAETPERGTARQPSEPEFTTRPRRLLMIGRVRPGQETAVLEAQLHYPVEAAARAAIERVEGFVGSGHYALLLEIDGDNAQQALTTYLNDPEVRAFHASLRPMVEGLPGPDAAYVPGPFHAFTSTASVARSPDGPAYSSGHMSLAASMFRWERRSEAGGRGSS